jgi:hypothetical protein
VELRARERLLGPAAVPLIRRLRELRSIHEIHFDDAVHLVEAARLDLLIEDSVDSRHHRLHRR